MSKILGKTPAASAASAAGSPAPSGTKAAQNAPAASPAPMPSVDVAAVLDGLKDKATQQLNWKSSIVDLMKLLSMDSSLTARNELAKELHYTGDTNESAAMNVWLHKQIMRKLAENGGKLPDNLKQG